MQADGPPTAILIGLQALQSMPRVTLAQGPAFIESEECWMVIFDFTLGPDVESSRFVPTTSRWCVLVSPTYPQGTIRVYPAKRGGVEATFPHQDRNDSGNKKDVWRGGKLCLDRATARLGSLLVGTSPRSPEDKLVWYIQRALAWLDAAARDILLSPGEPFEVPQVRPVRTIRIVHDESTESFLAWQEHLGEWGKWGSLEFEPLTGASKTLLASVFYGHNGNAVRRSLRPAPSKNNDWTGFWWIWPSPIVLPPWRAPSTWGELRTAGRLQGIDVDVTLRKIILRSAALEAPILLLGFPMPRVVGGDPEEIHWQAISLPGSANKPKVPNGFRNNSDGQWQARLRSELRGARDLPRLLTVNWHPDRTQARGRLHADLCGRVVAVIGVGALGAAVAELLVRAGVRRTILVDGDCLEVGNLVRHSLDLSHLGDNKAEAVAAKLGLASPMASVEALARYLPSDPDEVTALLSEVDIVVDCTAEDTVAAALASAWWARPKLFVSASVGYGSQRVFIFSAAGSSFPFDQFMAEVSPWLSSERQRWAEAGETLEGAGCWSPLFPARLDDLWLAAVATVKRIETAWVQRSVDGDFEVLEVQQESGRFSGLIPVEAEHDAE